MNKYSQKIYYKPLSKSDGFAFRAVPFDRFSEGRFWCDLKGELAEGSLNSNQPPDTVDGQRREVPPEIREVVRSLMEVLPERQRQAVFLYYVEEMTIDDIGLLMENISHQAVSRLLKRANRRIHRAIVSDPILFNLMLHCGYFAVST